MTYTATYSPEDNKLRLYSLSRLDSETYQRVKHAGFIWAPKQDCFVAPMWTPERADLLTELAEEIGDEETSLEERQQQRAERFTEYKENRTADAEAAHAHVDQIAQRFEGGQPILVGHHSERGARRDAERIENGMRKALRLWECADYWKRRAAAALQHARYKEQPGVRARRIKGLESDQRKHQRTKAEAERRLKVMADPDAQQLKLKDGRHFLTALLGTYDGGLSYDDQSRLEKGELSFVDALDKARTTKAAIIAHCDRWINHLSLRIEYERTMLAEDGATHLLDPKPRPKQLPLCNYRAPEGLDVQSPYRSEPMHLSQIEMTQKEYSDISTDYKGTRTVGNSHRVRTAMQKMGLHCVFITDAKTHTPPAPIQPEPKNEPTQRETYHREPSEAEQRAEELRQQLKAGVQVVAVEGLYPTPPDLAARMVELADICPGMTVCEPSAGTGNILREILRAQPEAVITAFEVNPRLADLLNRSFPQVPTAEMDFLETRSEFAGTFDRILMNPPFENAQDIEHIAHAVNLLKPEGRVIAICANGPRQNAQLKPVADFWEELPPGTFASAGTNVNTVLLSIEGYSAEELGVSSGTLF